MIEINTGIDKSIADQIVDQFRVKIVTGKMSEGDKLPSVRELAYQLSVNSKTISRAYAKLVELGLVVSQKGKGLFVDKSTINTEPTKQQAELDEAISTFANAVIGLDFSIEDISLEVRKKLESLYRDFEGDKNE